MKSVFSERLKEERLRNTLTQQELANLINDELKHCSDSSKKVSRVSITRYENGTRTPDYDTLCIISQVLETDLEYLLGKSNKKHYVAANEELNNLMKKITNVIEKDDKKLNNLLWSITYTFEKLINYGIENNTLDNIENIFDAIEGIVNMSVNKNKPDIVKESYKMLMLYARYVFYNTNPDYLKKQIELYKKHEKSINERLSRMQKEQAKENQPTENNSKLEENYKESYNDLKKQLKDYKEKQIRLENFIPYIAEEQKLIYKLLNHNNLTD